MKPNRRRLLQLGILLLGGGIGWWASRGCLPDPPVEEALEEQYRQRIEAAASFKEAFPALKALYNYGDCSPEALAFLRERLLLAAREEQVVDAQLLLAETTVLNNAEETLFWWRVAALNALHPDAQFALGCSLARGYGGEYNQVEAKALWTKAKNQGHAAAYLSLLALGRETPLPQIDHPTTAKDHFMVGLYAAAGHNQAPSPEVAEEHWEKALQQGYAEAGIFLAAMALRRDEIDDAIRYLEQATKDNNPAADTWLADLYLRHVATPEAKAKALELLLRASKANFAHANYLLGWHAIHSELNVPQEPFRYFRAAIEIEPSPIALYAYGACLFYGIGGETQAPEKALPWIKRAAEEDIVAAQWVLAKMYREGLGVEAQPQLADEWEARALKASAHPPKEPLP